MSDPHPLHAPNDPWLAALRFQDLQRLRRIVKAVHIRHYPQDLLTDREADRVIESFGRETTERLIKTAIDSFGMEAQCVSLGSASGSRAPAKLLTP